MGGKAAKVDKKELAMGKRSRAKKAKKKPRE